MKKEELIKKLEFIFEEIKGTAGIIGQAEDHDCYIYTPSDQIYELSNLVKNLIAEIKKEEALKIEQQEIFPGVVRFEPIFYEVYH